MFELDARTGELRKRGIRIKLQGKPLQVLKALLQRPGEIVSREELQRRLWPSDVFVDFEGGLNTAANRLRLALGDSAETPRFIETLPRVGYRFITPVERVPASGAPAGGSRSARRMPFVTFSATAAALVVVAALVSPRLLLGPEASAALHYQQITFGRGQISGARFAPDGESIVYTANWKDGTHLYVMHPSAPESRRVGIADRRLVAVSRSGVLALLSSDGTAPLAGGVLSRAPLTGGPPVDLERNVMSADWSADGTRLAIVRALNGTNQLEFPAGSVIHTTSGWISSVRVAADQRRIAFIEHPVRHDNQGFIKVAEQGSVRTWSGPWANVGGLAWDPAGDEVWFTATRDDAQKSLWAVSSSGRLRSAGEIAGAITLRDIAPDRRLLATRETRRLEMAVITDSANRGRDISLHDWSRVADLSPDGRTILFDESGAAAGAEYQVYFRRLPDESPVLLGPGRAMAFSPDMQFALTLGTGERTRFRVVPLGEGPITELAPNGLEYQWARYFPDGRRLLALANEPGQPLRLFVVPLSGDPYPITPPVVIRNAALSPDATRVAVLGADGKMLIYPVMRDGAPTTVPTPEVLAPILWSDENTIYVQHIGAYTQIPTRISRLNPETGVLDFWRELEPSDPVGINAITKVMMSRDTQTIVFNSRRVFSELFIASPGPRARR